ncbi:lytic transglycosylase domain-containing protein [Candidatus Gracilibacteria bacterium]|nr:lytic transglycosylase domain-containing protein [Candidatus Gracilibacteria bacterium]
MGIVYFVLIAGVVGGFFFNKVKNPEARVVFSYPQELIEFGGEKLSFDGVRGQDMKERFDREFLIVSNNLYQAFLYIKRYPLYIPYIKERLQEHDIHPDFIYLPIAESALRNDVVSHAGAAGIWQFMPDTARRYGLQVDDYIDERYHFEKSTEAALIYLKDLYNQFGDWALVAAAYNRGENGLRRDMASQGVNNYYDLFLNNETSRYVFRILAIKYMFASYYENKSFIDTFIGGVYTPSENQVINIVGPVEDLRVWSQNEGYNYREIRLLNPWIKSFELPEGEWMIEINH